MKLKIENLKLKIVFMGTPEFGAMILKGLIKANYKPVLVITAPDKPVGRKQILTPPPVKVLAEKYDIPIEQPEIIKNCKLKIKNLNPDLIVVVAYGKILPKEILNIPKYGCLNVHPSLLPKYRGPSPIHYAILNGDKETGATIILMDEKMDHGPIISSSKLKIQPSKLTYQELHDELANLGAKLLIEAIPKWIKGKIKPKSQNEAKATYTKILTKEDGKINWEKTAEAIEREIRAYLVWPGSYTFWQKTEHCSSVKKLVQIKILKARVLQSPSNVKYPVGKTLVVPQNEIGVQCGKGHSGGAGDFLVIEKLQMEGKKEMGAEEFLRGHPDFIGTILK